MNLIPFTLYYDLFSEKGSIIDAWRVQNTALQDVILTAFDQTQLDYFDPVKPTQRVHLSRSVNICCLI